MTQIALFRGINVGGKNIIAMQDLKRILEGIGCGNVRTYIQSGNVVFEHPDNATVSAATIADALQADADISAAIQVLTPSQLQRAAVENPFASAEPKANHLFFLEKPSTAPDLDAIARACKQSEQWSLTDEVFYLHAPEGIGRSKLAAGVERFLGVSVTARNARTVSKLIKIAAAT